MKSLSEIAHLAPIDGYQAANAMLGLKPGDERWNDSQEAAIAYLLFEQAGWQFAGYNEYGQELFAPAATELHQ